MRRSILVLLMAATCGVAALGQTSTDAPRNGTGTGNKTSETVSHADDSHSDAKKGTSPKSEDNTSTSHGGRGINWRIIGLSIIFVALLSCLGYVMWTLYLDKGSMGKGWINLGPSKNRLIPATSAPVVQPAAMQDLEARVRDLSELVVIMRGVQPAVKQLAIAANNVRELQAVQDRLVQTVQGLLDLHDKAKQCDAWQVYSTNVEKERDEGLHQLEASKQQCENLRDEAQRLTDAEKQAASEKDVWQSKAQATESDLASTTKELAQMKQEKDVEVTKREDFENRYNTKSGELDRITAERDRLADEAKRLTACLPAEEIRRIYDNLIVQCPASEWNIDDLRYVFSRLAVFAATGALAIDANDKSVMLRDAFGAFDKALYARLKGNSTLLRSARRCLAEELKFLFAGALAFEWPEPGDALDLKKHKQEEENGLGVIREAISATLLSGSGAVISKALVHT